MRRRSHARGAGPGAVVMGTAPGGEPITRYLITNDPDAAGMAGHLVRRARPAVARIDVAARWVGYHKVELAATGTPAVLAVAVSPWWAAVSGVSTLLWVVHEYRARRNDQTDDQTEDQSKEQD